MAATAQADTRNIAAASVDGLERLAEALELSVIQEPVKAIDANGDGRFDEFEDITGAVRLEALTVVDNHQVFLLKAANADTMALWLPSTNGVHVVDPAPGTIVEEVEEGDEAIVTGLVRKQSGWILVNASDARPSQDLIRVATGDGRTIPLERVFREGGVVRVLDDSDVAYQLVYDTTSGALSTDDGAPWDKWTKKQLWLGGAAVASVAALLAIGLLLVRGRKGRRGDAAATAPPQAGQGEPGPAETLPDVSADVAKAPAPPPPAVPPPQPPEPVAAYAPSEVNVEQPTFSRAIVESRTGRIPMLRARIRAASKSASLARGRNAKKGAARPRPRRKVA